MSKPHCRARRWAALLLVAGLAPLEAFGQADSESRRTVSIQSAGNCPSASKIQTKLLPLLSQWSIVSSGGSESVVVRDRGHSYLVRVRNHSRIIKDSARACDDRAKATAVFAAMVLEPPTFLGSAQSQPTETEDPTETGSEESPFVLRLDLGGAVHVPLDVNAAPVVGGQVTLGVGSPSVLATVGLGLTANTSWSVTGGRAELQRFPLELGLEWGRHTPKWQWGVRLGGVLELSRFGGVGFETTTTQSRFNLGPRLGLRASAELSPGITPFAFLGATLFPQRYTLDVDNLGVVGHSPRWWSDLGLGLSW